MRQIEAQAIAVWLFCGLTIITAAMSSHSRNSTGLLTIQTIKRRRAQGGSQRKLYSSLWGTGSSNQPDTLYPDGGTDSPYFIGKGKGKGKGKGSGGSSDDDDASDQGKGMGTKDKKGKDGKKGKKKGKKDNGKGGKGMGGKGKGQPDFCAQYDFRSHYLQSYNNEGDSTYIPYPVGKMSMPGPKRDLMLDGGGGKGMRRMGMGGNGNGSNLVSGNGKGKGVIGKGKGGNGSDNGNGDGSNNGLGGPGCGPNVYDVGAAQPDMTIFTQLLHVSGAYKILQCAGPFTVLGPTDEAFQRNPGLLTFLLNPKNADALYNFVTYHILPGYLPSKQFQEGPYTTIADQTIDVTVKPLYFNQAGIVQGNIQACNGIIHIIDDILYPPDGGPVPGICSSLDFRYPGQGPSIGGGGGGGGNGGGGNGGGGNGGGSNGGNGIFHRRLQYDGVRCRPNIYQTANRFSDDISTFMSLLNLTGLTDIFLCAGPMTALIPTNEAFNKLDPQVLADLLLPANRDKLTQVILYHILPGLNPTASIQPGPIITLQGENVTVGVKPVTFNGAGVLVPDVPACNGIFDIIDQVLIPPSIGGPSICAMYTFNSTKPRFLQQSQNSSMVCSPTTIQQAQKNPDYSTVVSLINSTRLKEILACPGRFTLLLPTNEAFMMLPQYVLDYLLDPANAAILEQVLLYHVLPGQTLTSEFVSGTVETLLQGMKVTVETTPALTFNGQTVVEPDVTGCNGVYNGINGVLIPPGINIPTPSPTNEAGGPTSAPSQGLETTAPTEGAGAPSLKPTSRPSVSPGKTEAPTLSPTFSPTVAPVRQTSRPSPVPGKTQAPTVATRAPIAATSAPASKTSAPVQTISPTRGATQRPTSGTAGPTSPMFFAVTVTDYYLAYVVTGLQTPLSNETLTALQEQTTMFYDGLFKKAFANNNSLSYDSAQFRIKDMGLKYNAGIPEDRFNLYINFGTDVIFMNTPMKNLPAPLELFNIMAATTNDYVTYITNFVRKVPALVSTNEVKFQATAFNSVVPKAAPITTAVPAAATTATPVAGLIAAGAGLMSLVAISLLVLIRRREKQKMGMEIGKAVVEASSDSQGTVAETATEFMGAEYSYDGRSHTQSEI